MTPQIDYILTTQQGDSVTMTGTKAVKDFFNLAWKDIQYAIDNGTILWSPMNNKEYFIDEL